MTDRPPPEDQPTEPIVQPVDGLEIFCHACHAPMPADASFCPRCGEARLSARTTVVEETEVLPRTRVVEEEIVEESPLYPVVDERPAWLWPVIALGTLLLLILLVLLWLAFADDDDDEPVAPPATTVPTAAPTSIVTVPVPQPPPPPVVITSPPPVIITTPTAPTTVATTAPTTTPTTAP